MSEIGVPTKLEFWLGWYRLAISRRLELSFWFQESQFIRSNYLMVWNFFPYNTETSICFSTICTCMDDVYVWHTNTYLFLCNIYLCMCVCMYVEVFLSFSLYRHINMHIHMHSCMWAWGCLGEGSGWWWRRELMWYGRQWPFTLMWHGRNW